MDKKYTPIPRYNNHGPGCSNHQNWMLDSEMTTREERDCMIRALDNYTSKHETHSAQA